MVYLYGNYLFTTSASGFTVYWFLDWTGNFNLAVNFSIFITLFAVAIHLFVAWLC